MITQQIRDFFERKNTSASPLARTWGFDQDLAQLKSRAERLENLWKSHVEKCHELILSETKNLRSGDRLNIIGSGQLIETPIQKLLERGIHLNLIDMAHGQKTKSLARSNPLVQLFQKDVTGLLQLFLKPFDKDLLQDIPWEHIPLPQLPQAEMTISANILSQLPIPISQKIVLTKAEYDLFAQNIFYMHLKLLRSRPEPILLYSDFETFYLGAEGELLRHDTVEVQLQDFKFIDSWIWHISPLGETKKNQKVDMTVKAFRKD